MGKQIQFDDAARDALRRGVDQLAAAVRVTLGPRGRNVVIGRASGAPTITNDGLTIAREIELVNPFENMGAQLVKEVAFKTGQTAGDGTTTATVLAHGIVVRGLKAIAAGHNPMAMKRGIDRAAATVVGVLRRQSRHIRDRDDLLLVATASGSDGAIGALIAEAMERVGRQGVITVDEGRGMETTLDVVEGVRIDGGYLSPYFVTDGDAMEAALENAFVLLVDGKLSGAHELLPMLEHVAQARRNLLVIAEDVEGEALATLVVNRLRGTLVSVAVKAPEIGNRRRELLEDLAVLTGAKVYARDRGLSIATFKPEHFGRAKRVTVDRDTTTIMEGGGRPATIRKRIATLNCELEADPADYERDWLKARIGRLAGGVAVIRVGGATEIALAERKARIEDALAATRAAVEEGIVPGGGVALLRAQGALAKLEAPGDEAVGVRIVSDTLEEPARQIAVNAGEDGAVVVARIIAGSGGFGFDAERGRYGDLVEMGIVDPTKVTRCAIQHASSIGGLLLTTDAIVVESPREEPPPEE